MRKFRTGDTIQVMRGKDQGKKGEILKIVDKDGSKELKVIVKGVNIAKRSQKPNPTLGIAGGIVEVEKPISISNIMHVDEKGKPSRIKFEVNSETGKKVRVLKSNGAKLDK